jgi:hypothetical protein
MNPGITKPAPFFFSCTVSAPAEGFHMCPTKDPSEEVKHRRYIEILAEEISRPVEDVEPVYDDVMAHLKENAQVTDFVPIFAWRRVREILIRR